MSSLLTNTSAMVALQTLRSINKNLAQTQSEISTGKSIGSARDNAAVWSIAKTMESDVRGFKAISDSLALGSSTVSVARQASETVTDLLTDMKSLIIAAQEENVDREKIQTDIDALKGQISSVIGAAQFNGLNLVDNARVETILSSLDRSGSDVTPSRINVLGNDLSQRQQVAGTETRAGQASVNNGVALGVASDTLAGANLAVGGPASAAGTMSMTFVTGGQSFNVSISINENDTAEAIRNNMVSAIGQNENLRALGVNAIADGAANIGIRLGGQARADGVTITGNSTATNATIPAAPPPIAPSVQTIEVGTGSIQNGDTFRVSYGAEEFFFVANEQSTRADVLAGLAEQINADGAYFARVNANGAIEVTRTAWDSALAVATGSANSEGVAGGGLQLLNDLNVSDFSDLTGGPSGNDPFDSLSREDQRIVIRQSLERSLNQVERMIETAISASASFGSVQGRIDTQSEFISKLTDSLTTGIGSLVDADMEETSARLQALQVQQQLAIQSLSIANQQPQNILALFR